MPHFGNINFPEIPLIQGNTRITIEVNNDAYTDYWRIVLETVNQYARKQTMFFQKKNKIAHIVMQKALEEILQIALNELSREVFISRLKVLAEKEATRHIPGITN